MIILYSMIWILGGYNGVTSNYKNLNSTEFISTKDGAINGPTLPEAVMDHCSVMLNGIIYLIGGVLTDSNGESFGTKNVWEANPMSGFTFTEGPSLINGRYLHGCATMSNADKNIIVIAGGISTYDGLLKSIEILDPSSNQWVTGTKKIITLVMYF